MSATPEPALMPEHRALVAVAMIGSTTGRPEHLSVPERVRELTDAALCAVGLGSQAAHDDRFAGDGFLRAYPSRFLPALVDMVSVLDALLAEHNRSAKPEIRLRVAVHLGELPAEPGLYRPDVDVSRLLGAAEFRQVAHHCREHITADALTTALILSDSAYQTLFQGGYTRVITRTEFAPLPITNKEFYEQSWVCVAGVHPAQLSSIPLVESARTPENVSGERAISNSGPVQGSLVSGDGNTLSTTPHLNVRNHVGGGNTGVQTGTFNGNFNHGQQQQ